MTNNDAIDTDNDIAIVIIVNRRKCENLGRLFFVATTTAEEEPYS